MFSKLLTMFFVLTVIIILGWYADAARAQIVEEGLVGYWSLDGASINGETITGVLASREGIIVGDPKIVTGKIGQALEFDGDDHIELPDDVSGKENVTISVWIRPTDFKSDRTVFGYWIDPARSHLLLYYDVDDDIWRLIIRSSGGDVKDIKVPSPEIDVWTHLAVSYEAGGELKLYIDGSKDSVDAPATPLNDTGAVWFGIGWDGSHPRFVGIMDEVCIYNRVLTQEEIIKNYKAIIGLAVPALDRRTTAWGKIKSSF